ncbi:hypothetical protein AB2S62_17165 [Vibrio sp. NTOU-M3]|uniref:hypothetical protein n=1 Tax=Vibrio sp. NTOU-M3 TaxID=3234954 RepID=UPI00349F1E4C
MKKLLLLTTCIANSDNLSDLDRMLVSYSAPRDEFLHIILIQGDVSNYSPRIDRIKEKAEVIFVESIVSLSKARNILYEHSLRNGFFEQADIVSFPDDDCWYPEGNLDEIYHLFHHDEKLDMFVCRFSENTKKVERTDKFRPIKISELVSKCASVTIFCRTRVIDKSEFFDESLGIGSPNNGGEDLDFAMRSYINSSKVLFSDCAFVGHLDEKPGMKHRYFRGGLKALRKNSRKHPLFFAFFIRKILVGFYYVAKYKMPLNMFFSVK